MSLLSLVERDILPLAVRSSSRLSVEAVIYPLLIKAGEALIQLFFYNSVFRRCRMWTCTGKGACTCRDETPVVSPLPCPDRFFSRSKCQTISTHLFRFVLQTVLPLLSFHSSKVPQIIGDVCLFIFFSACPILSIPAALATLFHTRDIKVYQLFI